MLSFFTIPSASSVISSSTDYAGALTTEFLPLIYVVIGVVAAVVLVKFLGRRISKGLYQVSGQGRRGGRRMRR